MNRYRSILVGSILLLVGCAHEDPKHTLYPIDVSNCDPRERDGCLSVDHEQLREMMRTMEENERLFTALHFCQKKL